MENAYNLESPKRATNLSVNSDLLTQAKRLGINLSALFEQSLADKVKQMKSELWLAENRDAIAVYNNDVLEHGVFSDGLRSF